jgi:ABC-type spermidine/putrescine transport system permease subunit II
MTRLIEAIFIIVIGLLLFVPLTLVFIDSFNTGSYAP